eukprot:NODE_1046_length_1601_cov_11.510309_g865_i0.p1 GENE.NODE_1046_length_1601_cov_11.510309_g865_i0~~NODE_1046_length_1601_cov_11.510309_g865_i0.p1  ORF type:complete len:434 (-),score=79.95 NODE_1046_length_1601_cov_11.510309_g865_i0:300-1577(-)
MGGRVVLRAAISATSCSTLVWSFAVLALPTRPLFAALSDILRTTPRVAAGVDLQGVANILWAYATLSASDPPMFAFGASLLLEDRLAGGVPVAGMLVSHASILWAFATARQPSPALLRKLGRSLRNEKVVDPPREVRAVTSVIWAFAALRHPDPPLIDALARLLTTLKCRTEVAEPRIVSALLRDFASLRHTHRRLFRVLEEMLHDPATEAAMNAQDITGVLWAMGWLRLGTTDGLFRQLARRFLSDTDRCRVASLQDLNQVAFSFCEVRLIESDSTERLAVATLQAAAGGPRDPTEVTMTVWAISGLLWADPSFYEVFITAAFSPPVVANLTCFHVVHLMCSLAFLGLPHPTFYQTCSQLVQAAHFEDQWDGALVPHMARASAFSKRCFVCWKTPCCCGENLWTGDEKSVFDTLGRPRPSLAVS